MKIYTKTGDKGSTSLIGGRRVKKCGVQIEAYGTIDELNAFVGLLRARMPEGVERDFLFSVQRQLFVVGGMLALDVEDGRVVDMAEVTEEDVRALEAEIDRMSEGLPLLRDFVVPGDSELSALCHVCRTVARRAERAMLRYDEDGERFDLLRMYVNRLSDYFFALARFVDSGLMGDGGIVTGKV